MAAPVYASDLTDIFTDGTTTGWTALGGGAAGLNQETDYFIQNTSCLSKNAWASATKGMIYNATAQTVAAGDVLFVWMTHQTANSLDTEANGGIRFLIGSGTGDYYEYYVSGKDIIVYDDRWVCFVIDPRTGTVAADVTTGTPTATTSHFGGLAKMVGGPSKGSPFAIDAIRHGRAFTYTLGDLGNGYATFDGGATYNDAIARVFGQIQLSGGVYKIQGLQELGTSATVVDFRDTDRNIVIARTTKTASIFNGFEVNNASSRVDWTRINIIALGTQSKGYFEAIDNADINFETCVFTDMSTWKFLSNSTIDNTTFRRCELITQGGAAFDSCIIDDTADTVKAMIASNPANISNSTFISGGTGHAIEIDTTGTYAMDGNVFTGYAATDGSTGDEVIYNNSGGLVTLNITNGLSPTIRNGAGATTVVNNNVAVTFDGMKDLTEVRIYTAGTSTELAGIENATAGTTDDRSFLASIGAGVSVDYVLHSVLYETIRVESFTWPSTAATLPVQQRFDRNNDNP